MRIALLIGSLLALLAHTLHAQQHPPLTITRLTDSLFVFTTWQPLDDGSLYPANGAYIATPEGAVMLDTPWDTTQFQPLLDSIVARDHGPLRLVISTHFHADRTAGLTYYSRLGVPTYTHLKTHRLCAENGEPQSEFYFLRDTTFLKGGYAFKVFHHGAGHAPDNIVVWMPQIGVLYGGCLIKSMDTRSIGNLSHADLPAWQHTMKRMIPLYRHARYVIPGHLSVGGSKCLKHTLRIVRRAM